MATQRPFHHTLPTISSVFISHTHTTTPRELPALILLQPLIHSSVGQPPFVTAFANADITSANITCAATTKRRTRQTSTGTTEVDCLQPSGTVIGAPITSMIA